MVHANGAALSSMCHNDVARHYGHGSGKTYVNVTRGVSRLFLTFPFEMAEQDIAPAAGSMIMIVYSKAAAKK